MSEGDPRLLGALRAKLIDAKQSWAKAGRLLTGKVGGGRLPPGQRLTQDWPVLDLGLQPHVALDDWRLTVDGLVEHPFAWDWATFLAQPQLDRTSDIHCVTAWSRYDNRWQGVAARHLLALAQPKPEARFILFHSHDGYTTNVPLDRFDAPDAMIAHAWNGAPIERDHGGPARVVIPSLYFWKSAKWVRRVEFLAEDRQGFWEERGYHNRGDPWLEQRYG